MVELVGAPKQKSLQFLGGFPEWAAQGSNLRPAD